MEKRILVWDLPTRLFHWLLAGSFIGAYFTAESERLRGVHETLGYTLLGLIAFRVLWGLVGTRYARFRSFLFGPSVTLAYVRGLLSGKPQHYLGHNPAGSWAVYGLLLLGVLSSLSGIATENDLGGEWFEEIHEFFSNGMLMLVLLHIGGVFFSSWMHHENLARAMLDGHKRGDETDGVRQRHWFIAVALLATVVAYWSGLI